MTRHGHGCEPRVEVFFQLAEDPALGTFMFVSGSWDFAEEAIDARRVLQANDQPAHARLSLRRTDQRLYSGRTITYTRPVLTLVGTFPGSRIELPMLWLEMTFQRQVSTHE